MTSKLATPAGRVARLPMTFLQGIDGYVGEIEVALAPDNEVPFRLLGASAHAEQDMALRLSQALGQSGYVLPTGMVVQLSSFLSTSLPNALAWPCYDLPVAVAALWVSGQLSCAELPDLHLVGELAFDGRLRAVKGCYPFLAHSPARAALVPAGNAAEAQLAGCFIYTAENLAQVVAHLEGEEMLPSLPKRSTAAAAVSPDLPAVDIDLEDISGQDAAKRALEVAAAGRHHLLLIGSPGVGKSMLARALPGIVPPPDEAEIRVMTAHASLAGQLPPGGIVTTRPLRAPNPMLLTPTQLIGYGATAVGGECVLASGGILLIEDLAACSIAVLRVIRELLVTRAITVHRAGRILTIPVDVQVVACMRPCPCGYYLHPTQECLCTFTAIKAHQHHTTTMLDDLFLLSVEVPPLEPRALFETQDIQRNRMSDPSARVLRRVVQARRFAAQREAMGTSLTARIEQLDPSSKKLLQAARSQLHLSERMVDHILALTRTIADLGESSTIQANHLAEAIHYRPRRS